MFHERDLKPYRDLLPWSGEFAGKYMIGAYYIYKLTLNKKLYLYMQKFIDELITCIAEDGYTGLLSKGMSFNGSILTDTGKQRLDLGRLVPLLYHVQFVFMGRTVSLRSAYASRLQNRRMLHVSFLYAIKRLPHP